MPHVADPSNIAALQTLDPAPALLRRISGELSDHFRPDLPLRLSRAPGRLDVMGGIADYTGSLVCEATLDCAAAVAVQTRQDRQVHVISLNLKDDNSGFAAAFPLQSLAEPIDSQRRDLAAKDNRWAGYLAGCLAMLHDQKLLDLNHPEFRGVNIAVLSTVPPGAGVSSSAAIEVATMINLCHHFDVTLEPLQLAALCQQVENRVVGAPCGIMDQVSSCLGEAGSLLRMLCQPHTLQPPLKLPQGVCAVGINSRVKHSVAGGAYGRTRCAAFMAHRMILEKMRDMGRAAGKELLADPMNGYLANLDPDDYKRYFRPDLPETMLGADFLRRYERTIDQATQVRPDEQYPVQHAADHHVLEARRVKNFVSFVQAAHDLPPSPQRRHLLDKAGHLMYASHISYTRDAMLGADECDLLVDLVRRRESRGLYGAKITGGGGGGTVAVLCDQTDSASAAIDEIMREYHQATGHQPQAFTGTSPGAWHLGTKIIRPGGSHAA
ncbi:MAG TPA: hypothetical protein VMD30_10275 [Tepidisphaeraceae bacterium]|nr:hypothetical protein [Tepidisphaeraceae bacterium]